MKNVTKVEFIIFFILINSLFSIYSFKCGTDKLKPFKAAKIKVEHDSKNRNLSPATIRIYVDYTEFDTQTSISSDTRTKVKKYLDETVALLEAMIIVKSPVTGNLVINLNGEKCQEATIPNTIQTTGRSNTDLILFPVFSTSLGSDVEAAAAFCAQDGSTSRPLAGAIMINSNASMTLTNAEKYFKLLLIHELTHVLVFHTNLYSSFLDSSGNTYSNPTITKTINGVSRKLLATPKVIAAAKAHYGCSTLTGVELEDQGGDGSAGSHWESRTMLGDYMISSDYPEVVISDISMALFEDSGWYSVNAYTGGLFRFGKNQGCNFLEQKCITSEYKPLSLNDFCNVDGTSMCTSGRTAKASCYLKTGYSSIPSAYQYWTDTKEGGFYPADYCPVAYQTSSSSSYYPTNCQYGSATLTNEVVGNSSFCMISSLDMSAETAICYPISCDNSAKTVKVTIGSMTYTCPKAGGKVTDVSGHTGTLYCPDYNLVCTGSVLCNDLVNCINNASTLLTATYDYTPASSQIETDIKSSKTSKGDFLKLACLSSALTLLLLI